MWYQNKCYCLKFKTVVNQHKLNNMKYTSYQQNGQKLKFNVTSKFTKICHQDFPENPLRRDILEVVNLGTRIPLYKSPGVNCV